MASSSAFRAQEGHFPTSPDDMNKYHHKQTGNRGQIHIESSPVNQINYQLQMQMLAYYQYLQYYQTHFLLQQAQFVGSPYVSPRAPTPPSSSSASSLKKNNHSPSADSGISSGPDSPGSLDLSSQSPAWLSCPPHHAQDGVLDLSKSAGAQKVPFPSLSPSSSSDESTSQHTSPIPDRISSLVGIRPMVMHQGQNELSPPSQMYQATQVHIAQKSDFSPVQECDQTRRKASVESSAITIGSRIARRNTKRTCKSSPYTVECSVCNKVLKSRSILTVHMRTHTGEKPYTCDTCGKSFADHSVYWRHKRIHTGEKRYACDICGQRFTQRGNISRHKEAVHGIIKVD